LGTLQPTFAPSTYEYTLTVNTFQTSIKIAATVSYVAATLQIATVSVASGIFSSNILLSGGNNTIPVTCIAEDGFSQTNYTVYVNRVPSKN